MPFWHFRGHIRSSVQFWTRMGQGQQTTSKTITGLALITDEERLKEVGLRNLEKSRLRGGDNCRIPLAGGGVTEKGETDSAPRYRERKDKMQPSQHATRDIWVRD